MASLTWSSNSIVFGRASCINNAQETSHCLHSWELEALFSDEVATNHAHLLFTRYCKMGCKIYWLV